ncbi:MAG: hypothetical protein WBZ36_16000 [Candidatus Nitrosopolaris sp.]
MLSNTERYKKREIEGTRLWQRSIIYHNNLASPRIDSVKRRIPIQVAPSFLDFVEYYNKEFLL